MKRVTTKKLIEILKRIDKCENFMQVCFLFDHLPEEIKSIIK